MIIKFIVIQTNIPSTKNAHWKEEIDENIGHAGLRAFHLLSGCSTMTSTTEYTERLNKLNLTTLVCRRARGDMLETFKYLNGQYNSAPILHLDTTTRTHGTTTHGHQLKLEKGRSRLDVRKHFFTQPSCEFVERSSCEFGFGPHSECI